MATVLALEERPTWTLIIALLVLLAFMKPFLAFSAWFREQRLHHRGDRPDWLHARVLAELCRGALAMWALPIQPMDASDEEDFPKVKRLIRSLRLLREQDVTAKICNTPRLKGETQAEADMRAGCANYIQQRLRDQAQHYAVRSEIARKQLTRWRLGFMIATWVAICLGLALAANKVGWAFGHHPVPSNGEHWIEALVIIAPFVAAHCLGMMTIRDCTRRQNRYKEMSAYLNELGDQLQQTQANSSRIRVIEHAERMMIEELHEWFSVMRNLNV